MADYSMMEAALEVLAAYGPDLRNGLSNHGPMAVEALAAMGRADAVMPWVEEYRKGMVPRETLSVRIAPDGWRSALGDTARAADWSAFFANELADAPWRAVLARWIERLMPGICASATHGVIRVAHASRSLAQGETPARIGELADAFASWTMYYQTLPTGGVAAHPQRAQAAIAAVPVVPPAQRRFTGTITSSLEALDDFPPFAGVFGMLDVSAAPGEVVSDMSETFARVYLTNAHDVLSTIVFVHGITSVVALRSLLPVLPDATARTALRYAWQSASALYSAFATAPPATGAIEPPRESPEALVDHAIANGDEHAIKVTEACLREHDLRPSPAYLAAARHATGALVAS